MTYTYSGNRLTTVADSIGGDHEVDFVQRGGGGYTYYVDGSLKSDTNKEITNIIYDTFLKKPVEIQLTGGRWVKMYYDGSGKLLKRAFSTGEYWEFVGAMIFKNGQFFSMATPDGRAVYNGSSWEYEFFIQDHLGNTRIAFKAENGQLIKTSETAFDPTGIELAGVGQNSLFENRFKHQGKESLALFGLSNIEDFGARYLDKSVMRWQGVDMMSEKYSSFSPYNYVLNNPIYFIDPDGNDIITTTKTNYKSDSYESKSVKINITLTIVNSTGSDLSKTIFNNKSGNVKLSGLSGSGSFTVPSTKSGKTDVELSVETTVQYRVVSSLDQVGKNDHVMMIVDDIPQANGLKVNPVGLTNTLGGHVMAVEKGTLSNGSFNHVATHELGHSLGLDHTNNGGLMNESVTNNSSLTSQQKGLMAIKQSGGAYAKDGTTTQSKQNPNDYKKSSSTQASEFKRKNSIN